MLLRLLSVVEEDSRTTGLSIDPTQEADHRIANSLGIVAALLRTEAHKLPSKPSVPTADVRVLLQSMAARVDAIGRLHRLVTHKDHHANVDLASYLREVAAAIGSSLSSADRVEYSFELVDQYVVTPMQGAAIGLILCEAIANAIKYAHPAEPTGKVLAFARRKDDTLEIGVTDDGGGLPKGFDPNVAKTTGFVVMNALANQLGAKLSFASPTIGLTVRLEMPIANLG
jgi:two-component sensor histidine kinase